jgi:hypothetical protein
MLTALVGQGYGLRGKSRWIREAIVGLLDSDRRLALVGVGDELGERDATEVVVLTLEIEERISDTVRILRQQDPYIEGVKSQIIRSAIRYRLGTPDFHPVEIPAEARK